MQAHLIRSGVVERAPANPANCFSPPPFFRRSRALRAHRVRAAKADYGEKQSPRLQLNTVKSEARSSKSETISNVQNPGFQNKVDFFDDFGCFEF